MANYGVKITEDGYDIDTATIQNVIFDSRYPFLKIHSDSTSQVTVAAAATSSSISFAHSLGYVPAFIMFSTAWSGDTYERPMPRGTAGQPIFGACYASSTEVKFLLKLDGTFPEFDVTIRCIIFKDRIS